MYNTVGFISVYPIISMYYKHRGIQEVEKLAEEELVEVLVFEKEDILKAKIDFRWIHSREFKYNGDMYDIVKKQENNDQIILHCINDIKEKKFEEEFQKKVNDNSANKRQKTRNYNPFKTSISKAVQNSAFEFEDAARIKYGFNYFVKYIPICSEIPSPPPKLS